jgi:hypothetical protein
VKKQAILISVELRNFGQSDFWATEKFRLNLIADPLDLPSRWHTTSKLMK